MRGLLLAAGLLLLVLGLSAAVHGSVGVSGSHLEIASPSRLWSWIGGTELEARIFWNLRLPRLLAAVVVGAGLATAGCTFQAVLGNPLAEPYTLGISSGSALAAVLAIRLGLDAGLLGVGGVGLAALCGAVATVFLVWRVASLRRSPDPSTLLLAGITVAMFCGAATMIVQYTAEVGEVYRMVRWMMGGLDGVRWNALVLCTGLTVVSVFFLLARARDFNALSAGADAAASLGTRVRATAVVAFVCCALIVGAGIAVAGPIGFVGLIVPHSMRALVGADHRRLLPASALGGAALLLFCDLGSRTLLYPAELPVGVLTALLGGPFFLLLLLRSRRGEP